MENKKIMIVGVGGQGTLRASRVLGYLFLSRGLDVKVSEVHGMSQRGGSVVTYICCGEKVYSPIIDRGEADIIISFELLEAARYAEYLKPAGKIVVNTQKLDPMPVLTGAAEYPADLVAELKGKGFDVEDMDCLSLPNEAGSSKAVNIVLMGRLSKFMDFPESSWISAIEKLVKPAFLEINKKAFALGRK